MKGHAEERVCAGKVAVGGWAGSWKRKQARLCGKGGSSNKRWRWGRLEEDKFGFR